MTALVVTVLLLVANGFFVGAEFALIAARRTRMEKMDVPAARAALSSMSELSLTLSGAQLGITACSLGLGYVAEPAIARGIEDLLAGRLLLPDQVLHSIALVVALTIVVFLHMVVGEMAPKNIAISAPERTAVWVAFPMRAFTRMFRPLIAALTGAANLAQRLVGVEPRDELATARTAGEIASMLAASRREGMIGPAEHGLLVRALDFRDREVSALMVPWDRVVTIDASTTVAGAERTVRESGHSRLPVLGEDPHDVLGFVHAKDLLRVPRDERPKPVPPELVRDMLVIRGTTKLERALVRMRRTGTHFAVVVDAMRLPVGIVTLEDVLEELVGPIADEHDVRGPVRRVRRIAAVRRRKR